MEKMTFRCFMMSQRNIRFSIYGYYWDLGSSEIARCGRQNIDKQQLSPMLTIFMIQSLVAVPLELYLCRATELTEG